MRKSLLLVVATLAAVGGLTAGTFLSGRADAQPPARETALPRDEWAQETLNRATVTVPDGGSVLLNDWRRSAIPPGQPWEYKVYLADANRSVETALNELGAAGWELSSTSALTSSPQVMFVFKRPKALRVESDAQPSNNRRYPYKTPTEDSGRVKESGAAPMKAPSERPSRNSEFKLFRLQRADAASTAELLKKLMKSCEVEADTGTNSLVVRGPTEELLILEALLQRLDEKAAPDGPRRK